VSAARAHAPRARGTAGEILRDELPGISLAVGEILREEQEYGAATTVNTTSPLMSSFVGDIRWAGTLGTSLR
jgi:hypothetical protein